MLVETLRNSDSLKVTVHFADISARDALSVSHEFKKRTKEQGLILPTPNKFDHAKYTDLYFRVPEQPENWKKDMNFQMLRGSRQKYTSQMI